MAACFKPVHELFRLFREPDAQEGIDGKGRITDPRVPIIPIAFSADAFRKAARRRGDDRSRRLKGEQFEGQGRALHHFAPSTSIGTPGKPLPPVGDGLAEESIGLIFGDGLAAGIDPLHLLKGKRQFVPLLYHKFSDNAVAFPL